MDYRIDGDYIFIKTDFYNEIGFYVDDSNNVAEIELTIGGVVDPKNDDLNGIFVFIDGDFKSISQLISVAEDEMIKHRKEVDAESRNWEDHINSFRNAGLYRDWETDRKSTRLNSSHITRSRMPSSA